jgi:hypothetical protein
MRAPTARYRRAAAILACILLFGVLTPAIGAPWLKPGSTPALEICGGTGDITRISIPKGTPAPVPDASPGMHSCLFCLPQHQLPALPTNLTPALVGLQSSRLLQALARSPVWPSSRFDWSVTQARAPPA